MPTSSTTQRQHSPQNRVSYCINPKCQQRQNPDHLESCQSCGTPLLIKNRYRLILPLRPLSTRGHAEIFEVEDLGVEAVKGERYKVLKVLKKTDSTLVRLFKQEAEALNNLNHPGIPRVKLGDGYFTFSFPHRPKTLHCLVMEQVAGENLKKWVAENGAISQEKALDWLKQLLEILDYLHNNKYLHRDIKPSNIMLQPSGQLMLIDFGTVRKMTATYIAKVGRNEEGTCVWSGGYTPDEVMEGKAFRQSDFYALGRTFVYLLTGSPPLELLEESGKLNWRESAPQVSPPLADWIDYLMAPSLLQRPPNTSFILKCLEGKTIENLPSPPVENPPLHTIEPASPLTSRWLIILNFVLFSILLVTGLLWYQRYQRYQENEWQVPREEKSLGRIRNN
ncbi:MAG TPA: serine/threonine-protein kinase [Coleofasciculaceae cyanobacterium]|jgi:serine/threonine protein kinase